MRKLLIVVVVIAVVAGGALYLTRDDSDSESTGDQVVVYAPVEQRTLQDVITVQGEVRHEETGTLNMLTDGRITAIEVEDGDTVEAGRIVMAVNGRPAVAAPGDFPFWRPLSEGAVGFDVWQLETILADFGYDPGPIDLDFTAQTRSAVLAWQEDYGYSGTETEADESITVSLSGGGAGYDVGPLSSAGATIVEARGGPIAGGPGAARAGSRSAVFHAGIGDPQISVTASPTNVSEGEAFRLIFQSDINPLADTIVSYTVGGSATKGADYDVLVGTVVMEAGESIVEQVVGTFGDEVLEGDETIEVSIVDGADYDRGPSPTATVTIVDETIPELDIEVSPETVTEGEAATFTIVSTQKFLEDVQVSLQVGGDATEEDDYEELPDEFTMTAGTDRLEIPVTTLTDDILEGEEELSIQIQNAQFPADAYDVGNVFEATLTITEPNDGLPLLSIRPDQSLITEGDQASFVIESDVEVGADFEVQYEVLGSATSVADYPEQDGTFDFGTDTDEATLNIGTEDDRVVEPDETIVVRIHPTDDYRVGVSDAVITIEDNDVPELSLSGGGTVTEGGTIGFSIVADQPFAEDTSVSYQIQGDAQAGSDYEAVTGVVVMRAGQTSAGISIVTIDDDAVFQPGDMVVGEWPTRIGAVDVDLGEFVLEGTPIMSLTEDDLTVTVSMSPSDRAELSEGLGATVELAATGAEAPGTILELDDAPEVSDSGVELYSGEVTVEGELTVVDGATVNVDVVLEEATDAVAIPVASLVGVGSETEIRVVNEDGTLDRRSVETGLTEGAFVEVVSGVDVGEQVVVEVNPA